MPANNTHPASGGNATSGAGAAAKAKQYAAMAKAQTLNEDTAKYFAAGVLGMVLIFTIAHWSRFMYSRYASKGVRNSGLMRLQVSVARSIRHVLTHRIPGFISAGHATLILAYLGINIALTVTNVSMKSTMLISIANRLGWMAIINACFITFLALKNTPLAYLTAYSHERLNILHQVGGYTTVIYALLHCTLQAYTWSKQMKKPAMLLEPANTYGMLAVTAMFVTAVFAIIIRRIRYEVFYVVHVSMYIIILVAVGLHRPSFAGKAVIVTILMGCMWGSDRLLRSWRIFWYSYDNRAIITPLPNGGTRIRLQRAPTRAVAGAHCFLWIPKIRAFETHPFTIVDKRTNSLEFVISAYDGFTNDLHDYAVKNPGVALRASIDGPYGAIPNFAETADKIVLVAGGSGASFTFGVACNVIRSLRDSTKTTIDFVWTVREQENLSWFSKELAELQASPRVNLILHSTRGSATLPSIPPTSPVSSSEEKLPFTNTSPASASSPSSFSGPFTADIEKSASTAHVIPKKSWTSSTSSLNMDTLKVLPGRPDVDAIIRRVVSEAKDEERVSVAACGPDSLNWAVRRTTASLIKVKGPSVELHCEQFGW